MSYNLTTSNIESCNKNLNSLNEYFFGGDKTIVEKENKVAIIIIVFIVAVGLPLAIPTITSVNQINQVLEKGQIADISGLVTMGASYSNIFY